MTIGHSNVDQRVYLTSKLTKRTLYGHDSASHSNSGIFWDSERFFADS